jgi:MYXO-CTERM domain-containing protein
MDEAARLAGSDPETGSGGDGGRCAVATPGVHGSSGAWLFGLAGVLTALVGRRRRRG